MGLKHPREPHMMIAMCVCFDFETINVLHTAVCSHRLHRAALQNTKSTPRPARVPRRWYFVTQAQKLLSLYKARAHASFWAFFPRLFHILFTQHRFFFLVFARAQRMRQPPLYTPLFYRVIRTRSSTSSPSPLPSLYVIEFQHSTETAIFLRKSFRGHRRRRGRSTPSPPPFRVQVPMSGYERRLN